jgi:hypothetical protein
MSYDKADWHYGGSYPKDLPPENGGTHIGIFLAWAILHYLEGEELREDEVTARALDAVRNRTITGRDFLFEQCDEKFTDADLNEEGNRFAGWYYETNKEGRPSYLVDYPLVFLDAPNGDIYYLENSWANYDRMALIIDRRFDEWKRGVTPQPLSPPRKKKSWWKFW